MILPDVNRSGLKFGPEKRDDGGKAIRFGLAAIKNVGGAAMAKALEERDANGAFAGLEDFVKRAGLHEGMTARLAEFFGPFINIASWFWRPSQYCRR